MAFYDEERILEDADSLSVAEFLGLEVRRAGSRHQIYCPGHMERLGKADNKMGSCFLTPKGYHCYACNKTVSLPNMVMEIEDCSYKEALGIIADSLGGRELYETSGKKDFEAHEKLLSDSDLRLIGLRSNVSFDVVVGQYQSKEEVLKASARNQESEDEETRKMTLSPRPDPNADIGDNTYLAVHHQTVSLKSILQESPEDYYCLIREKSQEAMDKYHKWLKQLDDVNSKESILVQKLTRYISLKDSASYDLKNIILGWYSRSKEIFLSVSPETKSNDTEKSEEQPKPQKKIRLDLFSDL